MAVYLLNLYPSKEINKLEVLMWRGNNVPTVRNPLSKGDMIIVIAHFGAYTENSTAITFAEYYGLSLGVCFSEEVAIMRARLNHRGYQGTLLNISRNKIPDTNDFFIKAKQFQEEVKSGEEGSQRAAELTYMVQMIYNPSDEVQELINGMDNPRISIVADYGGNHKEFTTIPVKKITADVLTN